MIGCNSENFFLAIYTRSIDFARFFTKKRASGVTLRFFFADIHPFWQNGCNFGKKISGNTPDAAFWAVFSVKSLFRVYFGDIFPKIYTRAPLPCTIFQINRKGRLGVLNFTDYFIDHTVRHTQVMPSYTLVHVPAADISMCVPAGSITACDISRSPFCCRANGSPSLLLS